MNLNYIKKFFNFLGMLYRNSYMVRSMVVRDLKSRYVGSALGFFWSVVHPLIQMTLYYFIFAVVFKMRLGPEYGGTHFAIWLIAGLLPWLFFAEVLNRSPGAVRDKSNLIKKMVFPSEVLPLIQLAAGLFNHLISLGILLIFLFFLGHGLSFNILLIIPYAFLISIFALGISWFLSAMNVFLRDVGHIVGVFVHLWFFLTPILYPRNVIPEKFQNFFNLNPMLHGVEGYRMALLGKIEFDPYGFAYLFLVGMIFLIAGGLTFKRFKPSFADVL